MPPATPSIDEPRQLESDDFSLVLGGPLFQLWRRSHLSDEAGNMSHRRALAAVLLAWAPLLLLSVVEGRAWSRIELPFLRDLELHARLLVALPLLILAELVVHRRMRLVARQFLEDGLVPDASRGRFNLAVAAALRLRNSMWAEVFLVLLVYVVGVVVVWRTRLTLDVSSWYGVVTDGQLRLTAAGWWLACVSLPLFQFLLLRWYFRLFIWARFLWQVSRIRLDLIPTHPDRCGGLGFLSLVRVAFAPFLFAQGILLAGLIADRIFFGGASLLEFEVEIAGVVVLMVCVILGPLCAFSPQLEAAENRGRREYGTLAQRHAREFDHKWLRGGARAEEVLIGSPDIQSLADMGNSFAIVEDMRWAPFTLKTVLHLAVTTLLPLLPLTLTMFSAQELLARLLKVLM
jgi:hypothetical protein